MPPNSPANLPKPDLPEGYYLANVKELLGFVENAYDDLLSEDERSFAIDFSQLTEPAARLYVRLLLRSKMVFRSDKLNYPEIPDMRAAATELEAAGFLDIDPELALEESFDVLTKPELLAWLRETAPAADSSGEAKRSRNKESKRLNTLKRAELEAIIAERVAGSAEDEAGNEYDVGQDSKSPSRALCAGLTILRTRREELFDTYKLCFFGNLYQDTTEFVLRDLGLTRFEAYRIDHQTRAFRSREQLDAHLLYYWLSDEAQAVEELSTSIAQDLNARLPELDGLDDTNLQRRTDRLRNRLARQLERDGEHEAALKLYGQSRRAPARERQARILAAGNRELEALELCREVIQSPENEEEHQIVSGFASRLARKIEAPWEHPKPYKPPEQKIQLTDSGEPVELQTRRFFADQGSCFYCENTLFDGVFGLAFWEQIFMPVPGAFFNPFQSAPTDFYEASFYQRRQDALEARFDALEQPGALQHDVLKRFESSAGIQNSMVNWRYLDPELVQVALQRIPLSDWLVIFRRMLLDTRLNRSGLPDLILFPDADATPDDDQKPSPYVLIEVKGPGDTLQKNQQRWMQFFDTHSIAHKLCHVSYAATPEVSERIEETSA